MFLADSNVLLDIFGGDPSWGSWSKQALRDALAIGAVGINPVIYAEISVRFGDHASLDAGLNELTLERLQLPYEAAFLAGRAFAATGEPAAFDPLLSPISSSARMPKWRISPCSLAMCPGSAPTSLGPSDIATRTLRRAGARARSGLRVGTR